MKVTIVKRMKRGKITARIPLYIGHCLKPEWREEKERKYGDSLNLSLRAIPWTRSRPQTSRKRIVQPVVFECIEDSDERLSKEEKLAIHWYNKAVLFRMEKLEKEALQFVEKALELNPNLSEAIELRKYLAGNTT